MNRIFILFILKILFILSNLLGWTARKGHPTGNPDRVAVRTHLTERSKCDTCYLSS